MKRPERFPPDDPRDWINRARSNLTKAAHRVLGVYLADLCLRCPAGGRRPSRLSQLDATWTFPYAHDLGRLLTLLEEAGETIGEAAR